MNIDDDDDDDDNWPSVGAATTVEELAPHEDHSVDNSSGGGGGGGRGTSRWPLGSFDEHGHCTHLHVLPVPEQPQLKACPCNEKRQGVCRLCNALINLGRTAMLWPYRCAECAELTCTHCTNKLNRRAPGELVCHLCDTSAAPGQLWTVVYRFTIVDRDRRHFNTIEPLPLLSLCREDAIDAALAYMPIVCPSPLSPDAMRLLRETLDATNRRGWIQCRELRSGYEVLQIELGLFQVNAPGSELVGPPQAEQNRRRP